MPDKCNTDLIIQQMESITVLKNLRKQVEEGNTSLPVSVEVISEEIERQRQKLEESLVGCGSLAPDEARAEVEESHAELELPAEEIPLEENIPLEQITQELGAG
jgi:hypothetical protein